MCMHVAGYGMVWLYVGKDENMYACIHVRMYASMDVWMHVYMYACTQVWMYGCMYVCMHATKEV